MNDATSFGGAISIYPEDSSSLTIRGSTFTQNSAFRGGAVAVQNALGYPIITGSTFVNNQGVFDKDVYSPPQSISTSLQPRTLLSGASLPSFVVSILEENGQVYKNPLVEPFQVTYSFFYLIDDLIQKKKKKKCRFHCLLFLIHQTFIFLD